MPAIILLDSSLSMNQEVPIGGNLTASRMNLAMRGLNTFLEYQAKHNRLDLTALHGFSREVQEMNHFTRDYAALKHSLAAVEFKDKTNLVNALRDVHARISSDEWGSNFIYHVLVVTDGNAILQSSFLNKGANLCAQSSQDAHDNDSNNWPLPLPFKSKIHILCMATLSDPAVQRSLPFFREILLRNSTSKSDICVNMPHEGGHIWVPNVPALSVNVIGDLFLKLCSDYFRPFTGKISCGNLTCSVSMYPNLTSDTARKELHRNYMDISICGFLKANEIANPPVYSKHLVLPLAESLDQFKKWTSFLNFKSDITDDELVKMFADEGRQPSFGVLLHGSFKIESMVALCQLNDCPTWFGILYSGTDNKKKSYLMMSTFEHGLESSPWVSKFASMGIPKIPSEAAVAPIQKKPSSYVVWLQSSAIQNDVQKILRYARKLPDKFDSLHSEVVRFKRTAIAFHIFELIDTITGLLHRESNNHPEVAGDIARIITVLNKPYDDNTC